MHKDEIARRHRRSTYVTMIVITLAIAAGRMAVVSSNEGDTAFLSANDRSRWCTIASLVEHGTYAIDKQIAITHPLHRHRRPWDTIDKVRHVGDDGKQHFYSSKPPLFPTLVAGVYAIVYGVTGMTLTEHPVYVARIILALVNLPLLAVFLVATIASIERNSSSEFARRLGAFACCFGTMVLPFSISLNNHLVAAAATALTMWLYLRAAERLEDPEEFVPIPWWFWGVAGLSAAFAAANELPALSMTVFWGILFGWLQRRSIVPFCAGVAVVAVGFFVTNWIAHESLRPAYAHRGDGAKIAELSFESTPSQNQITGNAELTEQVARELRSAGAIDETTSVAITDSDEQGRWLVRAEQRKFGLLQQPDGWLLTHWDDWYEYPGSYWRDGNRRGVDRGEPSRLIYFLHMTIGHHGIFSLTPIWLLMPAGLVMGLTRGPRDTRRLYAAILTATLVCVAFYLARGEIDRNYGGVNVTFRWLLWFAPLWIFALLPALQRVSGSAFGRGTVHLLVALSAFSMSTALTSPWQSPWLYQFWRFLGWIEA